MSLVRHHLKTKTIIHGIKRYMVTTDLSVNTPFDLKNGKVRMATDWMYQQMKKLL
ncbi:MAG: hypothetical protein LBE92_06735 [Chryseobacterium sp.]|uniref:hypothetical protein n=1 Tax=Chryseobacterium sp. TaxID=1871047 RepID=UPI0028376B63|nr:hypothetical protein [Chryseobacterium sp.]MDR2235801.1 hypothetical protein [Chryseobacterium sp.]